VVVDSDLGWTFLLFDVDQEDPEKPGSEIIISADVLGYKHGTPAGLIENPATALRHYLVTYAGFVLGDFDDGIVSATVDKLNTAGIKISGVITEPATHEQVIAWFCSNFSLDFWITTAGKICIGYNRYEAMTPGQSLSDVGGQILKGGFSLAYNQDVVNEMAIRHSYNPVSGEYGKTMENLENLASSDIIGKFTESLDLCLVGDDHTAQLVGGIRLFWSDEQRQLVTLVLSAPTITDAVELAGIVLVTHYAGPQSSGTGWVNVPVKVLDMQYQLNGTPILRVSGVVFQANDHSYAYGEPAANVVPGTVTESNTTSELTATWSLVGGENDPAYVWAYYKRHTEPISSLRFAAFVDLTDDPSIGTITFLPGFPATEEADALDVVLASESSTGVLGKLSTSPLLTLASGNRRRLASVEDLVATPGTAGINKITLSWTAIVNGKLRNYWVWRNIQNVLRTDDAPASAENPYAVRIADNITSNEFIDNDITPDVEYYYFVQALTKSAANEANDGASSAQGHVDSTGGAGPGPDLPTYDQPAKVTGFSVTEQAMVVDANGSLKSQASIVFVPPNNTADPNGYWKTAKIYRGKLVQADPGTPIGDQGATVGGATTQFDVVADLTESSMVILEPWAETSVFAAVSTGVVNNVGVEGRVDSLWLDAANYQETRSWAELGGTGMFAQSFVLDESRSIARWDLWMKRTGNLFTAAATLRLRVVNDSVDGPDESSVVATSGDILCAGIDVASAGVWVKFSFSTPASLSASPAKYWLVLEPTGTYAAEFETGVSLVSLAYSTPGTFYEIGQWATKAAGVWTIDTSRDAIFRNYTFYYPRVVLDLTPANAVWYVEDFFVTALAGGRSSQTGILCDAFSSYWKIPDNIDGAIIDSFDFAYSTMQGFNANVPGEGDTAVVYVNGLDRTMREYYRSDPGKTCYFAIRAKRKDGMYTPWTYFGATGCNTNASLRTPVKSWYVIGQIIMEQFRLYSYGFLSGRLFPNPAAPTTFPCGFEINSDGSAEFNEVFIRTGAIPGTSTNGLIYAGSIIGDYEDDWYGVFMSASGIVGRQKVGELGDGDRNPAVFFLAAQDYTKGTDPIHPTVKAGDFCVSTDVQRAYEIGDVPYLIFQPSFPNDDDTFGRLRIRSQVHITGDSTIEGILSVVSPTGSIWDTGIGVGAVGGSHLAMNALGISGWKGAVTSDLANLTFAFFADAFPDWGASAGDMWICRAWIGMGTAGSSLIEINPTSITSGNYIEGPTGAGFKLNTDGSAEFQKVSVRVSGAPNSSNLVYAGVMTDGAGYVNDWYGIFMSENALVGRHDAGVGNPNPVVFLLAADDFGGDAVHPAFIQGDFCISDNVKTAYEHPELAAWYLKATITGGLQIKADVTLNGSVLDGTTGHIHLDANGIYGHDPAGTLMFVMTNVAQNVLVYKHPTDSGQDVYADLEAGEFGAWLGRIAGVKIAHNRLYSSAYTDGGTTGYCINDDGTAVFHSVKVRVGGAPNSSNLVYAGSMTGDYEDDWYGIFMSSVALVGRRDSGVDTDPNPVVFLLAAQGFDGDAVHPTFLAGDFCISTDVKRAYWPGDVPYIIFQPSVGTIAPGSLRIRSQVHIIGDSTVEGTLSLIGDTGSSVVIAHSGITGVLGQFGQHDNVGFILATENQAVYVQGVSLNILAGQFGAWSGIIGGWTIADWGISTGNMGLYAGGSGVRIYAGASFASRDIAPFQVLDNGYLYIGKTGSTGHRTMINFAPWYNSSDSSTEMVLLGGPWNSGTPTSLGSVGAYGAATGGVYKGAIVLRTNYGAGAQLGFFQTDGTAIHVISNSSYRFRVLHDGDISVIKNINYLWPSTQGIAGNSLKIASLTGDVANLVWA